MRRLFLIFSIIFTFYSKAQNDNFFQFEYVNYNSFSVNLASESSFHLGENEESSFDLDINSLHGVFFTKYTSLSAGLGVNWHINKTHLTNYWLADFRWFLKSFGYESPYIFLQLGRNINWNSNFPEGGVARFGVGYTFESLTGDFLWYLQIFKDSKESTLYNDETMEYGSYFIESFGASVGITF
ncbi:MAG: hypothetical protein H6604_02070 [Flavobacteriales bacterium]|nr:hypothetical protein [Flavobacteriales bacterium]